MIEEVRFIRNKGFYLPLDILSSPSLKWYFLLPLSAFGSLFHFLLSVEDLSVSPRKASSQERTSMSSQQELSFVLGYSTLSLWPISFLLGVLSNPFSTDSVPVSQPFYIPSFLPNSPPQPLVPTLNFSKVDIFRHIRGNMGAKAIEQAEMRTGLV